MAKMIKNENATNNDSHRILILTLGVGFMVDKGIEDMDERLRQIEGIIQNSEIEKEKTYRIANYVYESDDGALEYSDEMFVANPIVDVFKPDAVIIIGTVKSAWSQFLYRFRREDADETELIKALQELEKMSIVQGIDTAGEDLNNWQSLTEELICSNIDRDKFPTIRIVLSRYGINKEQLQENYVRIRDVVSGTLKSGCRNEIAFDITHSFRSLPIYNLSVINYLKHIENRDVEITNVYYGNLDAQNEIPGRKSPLVDLVEITDLLDMSNGVSEFRKTGSLATLLDNLESHKTLRDLLLKFDTAVQLNNFTWIHRAVSNLGRYFASRNDQHGSAIADIEDMLKAAIENDILRSRPLSDFENIEKDYEAQRDLRYLLALWMWDQGRYGQAACVGLEALRSILTPYYLLAKGTAITVKNCSMETSRQASIDRLNMILRKWSTKMKTLNKSEKKVYRTLENLNSRMNNARKIRNTYAHILSTSSGKTEDVMIYVKKLNEFFESLKEVYSLAKTNNRAFRKLYCNAPTTKPKRCMLIISAKEIIDDPAWLGNVASGKKNHPVYIIPRELRKLLPGDTAVWGKNVTYSVFVLRDYVVKNCTASDKESDISVVFDESIGPAYKALICMILTSANTVDRCYDIIPGELGEPVLHDITAGESGVVFDETALTDINDNVITKYMHALEIAPDCMKDDVNQEADIAL